MKSLKFSFSILLLFLAAACNSSSDKELYDKGMNLITEQKYDEAVEIFNKLVEENNKSEYAPKALFENAKMFQGQVIKGVNPKESLMKAVELYKEVYNNYPNFQEAENSLFMAGFILANELKDYDKARETYELYLAKYPNGKLASDAKVELENLGKTPEEILMEKVQKENSNAKQL